MRNVFLVLSIFVLFGCTDIYGPERTVTFENATTETQSFVIDVNGEGDKRNITLPASETLYISFTGTYVKSELPLPFVWDFAGEDHWRIVQAPSEQVTITNSLPFQVTLKDEKISSFSCSIDSNNSKTESVYRTAHKFYLDGGREVNGEYLIDNSGKTYQYAIYLDGKKIFIVLLSDMI